MDSEKSLIENDNNINSTRRSDTRLVVAIILLISLSVAALAIVYRVFMSGFDTATAGNKYDQYYVMISNNRKSSFMQNVYEGAYQTGVEQDICVDLLGDNLPADYTEEDLLKIAISSEVDGIIIDANETEEMTELIDEAVEAGIPVVTLVNDNTKSRRCSFVGIGGYEIGREYGGQVNQIIKEIRRDYFMSSDDKKEDDIAIVDVAILVNSIETSTSQNVIISGITDTILSQNTSETSANVDIVAVDNSNAFSVEESIRDLFTNGNVPEVIICLDELSTTCVYQAVIDYNVVGKVNILGYYRSDTICNAIDREVIHSTISVDTNQLGRYCVNALKDYNDLGATSQYYTGDVTLINRSNVNDYLNKEDEK